MKPSLFMTAALVLFLLQVGCAAHDCCLEGVCCMPPASSASPQSVDWPVASGQEVPQLSTGSRQSAYGLGGSPQLFGYAGEHTRVITTDSAEAQAYFNEGLNWLYGFNHDEAVRSFTRAAELDPRCAMAWWGVAYAQGPNYNGVQMSADRQQAAWEATRRALEQLDDETPLEQALVRALLTRYADPAAEVKPSSEELRAAFAEAMSAIWAAYPEDADVGTMYAEAMMVRNPWRLWNNQQEPARDETLTIVRVLEAVLAFAPNHPGANHFYIHAMEASADKALAIPAADRLSTLVPMSGHLVHMPSHIYAQVGLWDRAVEQNLIAIEVDTWYFSLSPDHYRQRGYSAHNGHMLAFSAMMCGREEEAMLGARWVWSMPEEMYETVGRRYDRAMCAIYDVMRRFGRWEALLAEPAPPEIFERATAVWRACRAIAYAALQDFENAEVEYALFQELLEAKPNDRFLQLNDRFIAGEIALQRGDWDEAARLLEEAVVIEDAMGYGEPPRWLQPIRHTLGAVYLMDERYEDAERVYREDLVDWPANGWSLYGLMRSLELQGETEEAAHVRELFEHAWRYADHPLTTSCECIPEL